ncbi:MAG: glycosyltransferase family 4 protein [Candidatus Schekmanbacteria bacterium]|nr:glycosyltransferase family 4 protein [Candidatus Schekmanbacteria bacterium]
MKKLLMLAYAYPPSARTGTYRTLRFSKYLPDEGWQPIILTLDEKKYEIIDNNLVNEVPPVAKIYRTPAWLFYSRYSQIIKAVRKIVKKSPDGDGIKGGKNPAPKSKVSWKKIPADLLRTPDEAVGWIPFAFIAGLYLIYTQKIDAIYATGGPFSTFITAVWLKKISGKPLVVDFRDPWASDYNNMWSHPWLNKVAWICEKSAVLNADVVIANTETLKKQLVLNHNIQENKVIVINNGFDEADFSKLSKQHYEKFTIVFTGSFYSARNPSNFFFALRELLNEDKTLEDKIQLVFAGSGFHKYFDLIEKSGLGKLVTWKKQVEHKKALELMNSAHLLLLTNIYLGCCQIPSKTFEYFAAGKPILALAEPGALADLFSSENVSGKVVDPEDILQIKEAIKEFYLQYINGTLKEQPSVLWKKFNSRNLTHLLAGVLNQELKKYVFQN